MRATGGYHRHVWTNILCRRAAPRHASIARASGSRLPRRIRVHRTGCRGSDARARSGRHQLQFSRRQGGAGRDPGHAGVCPTVQHHQSQSAPSPGLANDAHERVGESRLLAVCILRQRACVGHLRDYRLNLLCGGLLRHGALLRCAESSKHHCGPVYCFDFHARGSDAGFCAQLCFDPRASRRLCTTSGSLWVACAAFT